MKRTHLATTFIGKALAAAMATTLLASPAMAQVANVNSKFSAIQTLLAGISVIIFSIALLWVGFKMAFQHAKWSEVSNIVIGGVIAGGATGIASWLLG